MKEKIGAVAGAVVAAVGYLKITIVTPSVTNRHTNPNPSIYDRGVGLCVIGNYSVGATVSVRAVGGGGVDG